MRLHSCGTSRVVITAFIIVVVVVAAPAITDSAIVSVFVVVAEHSVNGRHDHCRRTHYQCLGRSYKRQPRTSVAVSLLKHPSDVAKSMAHVDCTATSWVDIDVDGTVEGNYTAGSSGQKLILNIPQAINTFHLHPNASAGSARRANKN